jgi:hypothetical protein
MRTRASATPHLDILGEDTVTSTARPSAQEHTATVNPAWNDHDQRLQPHSTISHEPQLASVESHEDTIPLETKSDSRSLPTTFLDHAEGVAAPCQAPLASSAANHAHTNNFDIYQEAAAAFVLDAFNEYAQGTRATNAPSIARLIPQAVSMTDAELDVFSDRVKAEFHKYVEQLRSQNSIFLTVRAGDSSSQYHLQTVSLQQLQVASEASIQNPPSTSLEPTSASFAAPSDNQTFWDENETDFASFVSFPSSPVAHSASPVVSFPMA